MPSARLVGHVWWQCSSGLIRIANAIVCGEEDWLDFGALPPEINSGRMYCGPGSGPMLAAAAAWDEVAVGWGWLRPVMRR